MGIHALPGQQDIRVIDLLRIGMSIAKKGNNSVLQCPLALYCLPSSVIRPPSSVVRRLFSERFLMARLIQPKRMKFVCLSQRVCGYRVPQGSAWPSMAMHWPHDDDDDDDDDADA